MYCYSKPIAKLSDILQNNNYNSQTSRASFPSRNETEQCSLPLRRIKTGLFLTSIVPNQIVLYFLLNKMSNKCLLFLYGIHKIAMVMVLLIMATE